MPTLVTGGAGYIGSHTVKYLQLQNEEIVVVDDLQTGHETAVTTDHFYKADIRDQETMERIFQNHRIEGVIHFAANSLVGESMEKPYEYYHNNVFGTLCLLNVMKKHHVNHIVFSSTAAVYGEPEKVPLSESDKVNPTNAYGETKAAMEKMMKWFDHSHGIKHVSLRYFNAAGADGSGSIGEDHQPETHLIPLILQVALGKRKELFLFGDDYPTEDGTCVRDYIHVTDLAAAHYLALKYLRKGCQSNVFNLGNGLGYSVREVLEVARKVTGHPLPVKVVGKRAGDPAMLVASSEKAKEVLGWEPTSSSLERIVQDAWKWHRNHPQGYGQAR